MTVLNHRPPITWKPRPLPRRMKTGATVFSLLLAGCGPADGLNRQAVSGVVTLDGQPLAQGAILFEPLSRESGTAIGATIRRGAFAISRNQGAVPGTYRVRIYASSGKQAAPANGQTERTPRPMIERLPARYNTRSMLHADVVARPQNSYLFDLTSRESADDQ